MDSTGECSMCVPKSTEMYFDGDERDRVGMDATTHYMCFTFRYEASGWTSSHGIKVHSEGYTPPEFANSDYDTWTAALDMVEKGASVTSSILGVGAQVAALAATGGAAGR